MDRFVGVLAPPVLTGKSATVEFTMHELRKLFNREGVIPVLVTDDGTHLTTEVLSTWLKSKLQVYTQICQIYFFL